MPYPLPSNALTCAGVNIQNPHLPWTGTDNEPAVTWVRFVPYKPETTVLPTTGQLWPRGNA